MRGALLAILAAGLALGCVLAAQAADPPYAKVRATIAQVDGRWFGTASSRREGEDSETTDITEKEVSVEQGEGATSAGPGARGTARVRAAKVSILDGLVTARVVRRVVRQYADGTNTYSGAISDLTVEGREVGDVSSPRRFNLDAGGRVIVNSAESGIRVITNRADIRVAVVTAQVVEPPPPPTPSPTPTATAAPPSSATSAPTTPPVKRRKAPSVEKRLTSGGYAFPVYGRARVADNFGAERAKPIKVHRGVDIFAPFGSPVVAARDGRLSHVGTLPISGNRLWLHTENGDAFFYAHMSAFSRAARNGAQVKAGTVLGFVGNTGDAEPTPPHLHFQVHPGGMKKDPVDPYPIVTAWRDRDDVPPGAWLQQLGPDATERPGTLVTVRDFIAE